MVGYLIVIHEAACCLMVIHEAAGNLVTFVAVLIGVFRRIRLTEFVSFVNLILGLRVCFVNFSPSFYRLTLTFVYDFSSTQIHTHNIPLNLPAN